MTRGKQRRRWIAKAFRKAHRGEGMYQYMGGEWILSREAFRRALESHKTGHLRHVAQEPADPHYGRVEKPLTEKDLFDALEAAEKRNAGTPRFVAYGDSFADAFGLPRTGGAVVEVPRKP